MEIEPKIENISAAVEFIEVELTAKKLKRREILRAMLSAEESIVKLIEHSNAEKNLQIDVYKSFGNIYVKIESRGEKFDFYSESQIGEEFEEDAIRDIILKNFSENIKYENKNRKNIILITVKKSINKSIYYLCAAFISAILFSIFTKNFFPTETIDAMIFYFFEPIEKMFLTALKMLSTPLVFLSILICMLDFGSIYDLKKVGIKVMSLFTITKIIAALLSLQIYFLISPGTNISSLSLTNEPIEIKNFSIIEMVENIVPETILSPLISGNTLEIIFLASLIGFNSINLTNELDLIKKFLKIFNKLLLKMLFSVLGIVPLIVFCTISTLILKNDMTFLISLSGYFFTIILTFLVIILLYLIVMAFFKLNPIIFMKKYFPEMLVTFSIGSKNVAFTYNLKACRKKFGVDDAIANLIIPLGMAVHKDGSTIFVTISVLFLAGIYGIDINFANFVGVLPMYIVFLIFGMPGVRIAIISILILQIGIPLQAVSLILGLDSILMIFCDTAESLTDVALSVIVAKSENLLNEKIYNS